MKIYLIAIIILLLAFPKFTDGTEMRSLGSNKFTTKVFCFSSLDGRYSLSGELITPDHFPRDGKLAIFVAPPSIPTNKSYLGFFDVLADYLVKSGVAVLRFDTRNYTYKNILPNHLTMLDAANDTHAAFLEIKKDSTFSHAQIGLLGHSEGGSAVTIEAASNPDISFCILLAANGIPGDKLTLYQFKKGIYIDTTDTIEVKEGRYRILENICAIVKKENNIQYGIYQSIKYVTVEYEKHPELRDKWLRFNSPMMAASITVATILKPRIIQYIKYEPEKYISKINCPILAMYGNMDERIDAISSIKNLKSLLERNKTAKLKIIAFDSLNHSFQNIKDSAVASNGEIKIKSIPDNVLHNITEWLIAETTH